MQFMSQETPLSNPVTGRWITEKIVGERRLPYGWASKGFKCQACDEETWDGQNIGCGFLTAPNGRYEYRYEVQPNGKRKRVLRVMANFWVCYECRVDTFKLHN
jgi:hypothetical protein